MQSGFSYSLGGSSAALHAATVPSAALSWCLVITAVAAQAQITVAKYRQQRKAQLTPRPKQESILVERGQQSKTTTASKAAVESAAPAAVTSPGIREKGNDNTSASVKTAPPLMRRDSNESSSSSSSAPGGTRRRMKPHRKTKPFAAGDAAVTHDHIPSVEDPRMHTCSSQQQQTTATHHYPRFSLGGLFEERHRLQAAFMIVYRVCVMLFHVVPFVVGVVVRFVIFFVSLSVSSYVPHLRKRAGNLAQRKNVEQEQQQIQPQEDTTSSQFEPFLQQSYQRFATMLTRLGPTFIKLGQWMATRPDLFPPCLCEALAQLFDKAPVHSWAVSEAALRQTVVVCTAPTEKGEEERPPLAAETSFSQSFSSQTLLSFLKDIDPVPINSGSIAQVHRGVLSRACDGTPAGTTVAIKILHPNVRETMWADICVLRVVAVLFSKIVPGGRFLDPLVSWYEFSSFVVSQLNLEREAENLNDFRFHFGNGDVAEKEDEQEKKKNTGWFGLGGNAVSTAVKAWSPARMFSGVFGRSTSGGVMQSSTSSSSSTSPVVFPKPLLTLCSPNVIVETFERGFPLQEIINNGNGNNNDGKDSELKQSESDDGTSNGEGDNEAAFLRRNRPRLATIGTDMFLKMLFEDNFIHADLHAGNLLVRATKSTSTSGGDTFNGVQLVCLDCGLVTMLSKKDRENFVLLLSAVACRDGDLAATLMLQRSPSSHLCRDPDAFRRDMRSIFDAIFQNHEQQHKSTTTTATTTAAVSAPSISQIHFGRILGEVLNCLRTHRVAIDGHFATLVMAAVVGEGLARSMNPDFNIFAAAAPFLIKHLEYHELSFLAKRLQQLYGFGALGTSLFSFSSLTTRLLQ